MTTTPDEGRRRVIIEGVKPEVDGGRFAAKRVIGDLVRVEADVFTDGHDSVAAAVFFKGPSEENWSEARMLPMTNDRWFAEFPVTELGRYRYTVRGWVDHFQTWHRDLLKRIKADGDTSLDYQIGAGHLEKAAQRVGGDKAHWLVAQAELLRSADWTQADKRGTAISNALVQLMLRLPDRQFATTYEKELELIVDPYRARFSSWYEFFPRSAASESGQHGTFADATKRLDYVAGMGFDVVYFPPIHPIGVQFRKGKNNTTEAQPGDSGSPWAIGGVEGGHKSIHSELGTLDDFKTLVQRAQTLGLQVALDIAFQVSPDHPYVKDHEEWFLNRPDGTIQYAENPPKKYQDIYPFNFESSGWHELWEELRSVFIYWAEQGVRIFRVDNPHTKAFPFWEWAITEIKRQYPDVLFLSEAFTRPKVMYRLAKLGFSQSYTYFPWRLDKLDLTTYLTELTKTEVSEFFRPNQWPNTPDILNEFLQTRGRPGFMQRLILAATLGANYGIYGPAFELMESRPAKPGSEEYLNSEKYEIRHWDLDRPDSLRPLIATINQIRRDNSALHNDRSIEFHAVDSDQLICYSKQSEDGTNRILVVVNLDTSNTRAGFVNLSLDLLGIPDGRPFQVHDLITDAQYTWFGPRNYVELNPYRLPAHIFLIRH